MVIVLIFILIVNYLHQAIMKQLRYGKLIEIKKENRLNKNKIKKLIVSILYRQGANK